MSTLFLSGNKCIICEQKTNKNFVTKHHVFPKCIVTNLTIPYEQKKYDLVSLCRKCHDLYEHKANDLKNEILQEMQVPEKDRYYYYPNLKKILQTKKACILLFYHKDKIPKESIPYIEQKIRNYFNLPLNIVIPNHLILRGLNLSVLQQMQISTGKLIASKLKTIEEIEFMAQRWRNHFFLTIREIKKNFLSIKLKKCS